MKRILIFCLTLMSFIPVVGVSAQNVPEPDGTYLFSQDKGEDLFFDLYNPAKGSNTTLDGKEKPCIIFMFGGGFKSGSRDSQSYREWFGRLASDGYKVVSIDYRLGLKDATKVGLKETKLLNTAIHMAVEDLYDATRFIIENAEELEIDPDNIVICGSSAGAISVLQADWELHNKTGASQILPEGFAYKGVISYSGAIFSTKGAPKYQTEPAPTLFFHGTKDKLVVYNQLWFFNMRFAGSNVLANVFKKNGYNYSFYRFDGNGHEIAASMVENYDRTIQFLEENIIRGKRAVVDTLIIDPNIKIPDWFKENASPKDLYK